MDILEKIVTDKRIAVAKAKEKLPLADLVAALNRTPGALVKRYSLRQSLIDSPTGIIAEFKRKSPSKGWIKETGSPKVIPPSYAKVGAAACSILTDEKYFGGCSDFITAARSLTDIPILRKDFIIDAYQIYEAKLIGADAVLLIAADLTPVECRTLARLAHELNLETLLEIHSEGELGYIDENIDVVGVNNRNLGSFVTDVENSFRLADKIPSEFVRISESGISDAATVRALRQAGFRGFLIGEQFMRHSDPAAELERFIKELQCD